MVGAVAPRVQRAMVPGGERTWTLLGVDHRRVEPVEEFLEYLRLRRMSPNTVKSYARALGLWWEFLALLDLAWDDVAVEDFGRFQRDQELGPVSPQAFGSVPVSCGGRSLRRRGAAHEQ